MTYQLYLEKLVEEVEEAKQKSMALGNFMKRGKANKFLATAYGMAGDTVSIHSFTSTDTLFITMEVNKLDGFKDSRLEGILNAFEYLNPDTTSAREFAAWRSKETQYGFSFAVPDQRFQVRVVVTINANIVEDSNTCKRVIVGMTEGKPQPIYRLVCEGEEDSPVDVAPMPPLPINHSTTEK